MLRSLSRSRIGGAGLVLAVSAIGCRAPADLAEIERHVAARYGVAELTAGELAARLASRPSGVLLLDVRTADEYAISRIPGADRIESRLDAATFVDRLGTALDGREVVLYCSVGVRSARLARRVRDAALEAGAAEVVHLRGGIFRWYAEGLPMRDDAGSTEAVHPYGARWEKLLDRDARERASRRDGSQAEAGAG